MGYVENPPLREVYDDYLMHYGVGHDKGGHSGRYRWGSGKDPYQHVGDFLSRIDELKKQGLSESEIAGALGIVGKDGKPSTSKLRTQISLANSEKRSEQVALARKLRDEGHSLMSIAKQMGFENDSSVRSLLDKDAEFRMNQAQKTAELP